jgi:hypothetical protein
MPLLRAIVPLRQECGQANEADNRVPVSTLRYAAVRWHYIKQTADCSTWFAWCTLGWKVSICDMLKRIIGLEIERRVSKERR